MRDTPKPKLKLLLALVMSASYKIAPKKTHEWLTDMHFELGFISGFFSQLTWTLGALNLAIGWRFESLALRSTQRTFMTFASILSLFILLIFIPLSLRPGTNTGFEPLSGFSLERDDGAKMAEAAESLPSPASAPSVLSQTIPEIAGTTVLLHEEAESTSSDFAPGELSDHLTLPSAQASSRSIDSNDSSKPPLILYVAKSTQLRLHSLQANKISIFSDATLVFEGILESGESFRFSPPAVIITDSFHSLELYENEVLLALEPNLSLLEIIPNP